MWAEESSPIDFNYGGSVVIRVMVRSLVVLVLTGALGVVLAAPDAIGVVTANGTFRVDSAPVRGTATLFEGVLVETSSSPSSVRLVSGAEVRLGSASRARVYKDHLVLERGEGRMNQARYPIYALGLRIAIESGDGKAGVAVRGTNLVDVSALAGAVRVATAEGTLLARLEPGRALEFEPPAAGASAPFSVKGCVTTDGVHFLLKDTTANVTFELRGENLGSYAGQHVDVAATGLKGVQPPEGAAQVVQVNRIYRLAGSCPVPASTAPGSGSTKTAGLSGTSKAIIAGVAVAAVAGVATVGLTGNESDSTVSR